VIVSESPNSVPGSQPLDLRTLTHVSYGLFALGFLTGGMLGVATLAAVVLMYLKRSDAAGTVYASHFDWLLRTFWWSLLWIAVSFVLMLIYIGWIGMAATVIWVLYRLIKGWLALLEGNPPSSYA
ncbi:putative membrane protein, partial [Bordetella avium 197N]